MIEIEIDIEIEVEIDETEVVVVVVVAVIDEDADGVAWRNSNLCRVTLLFKAAPDHVAGKSKETEFAPSLSVENCGCATTNWSLYSSMRIRKEQCHLIYLITCNEMWSRLPVPQMGQYDFAIK